MIKTIAHVGTLKNDSDDMNNIMVMEWLCRNDMQYLLNSEIRHDDINLKWNRDYLLEDNKGKYNVIILHYLFRDSHIIPKYVKNDVHCGSILHTQANWNMKLNKSKADYIFCFGQGTEVTSLWFGQLKKYEMQYQLQNRVRMEIHRRIQ